MLESLARLIFELIQPGSQLIAVLILMTGLFLVGKRTLAVRTLVLLVCLWLLYTTPFLGSLLADRLENSYPVLGLGDLEALSTDQPVYVIVMGSGHTPDPRLEPSHMLTPDGSMRLVEGIRVMRHLPGSWLVTSAASSHGDYSQAEAVRDAAISLGMPPDRIYTQSSPESTCEEARAFADRFGPGTRVIIATSATHMRRAMMLFRKHGVHPIAAPTDFAVKHYPERPFRIKDMRPKMENLDLLEDAIKEYVGFAWDKHRC